MATATRKWTPNQDDDDPRCTVPSCRANLDRHPHEPHCPNLAPGEETWADIGRVNHPSGRVMVTQKWNGETRSVVR